MKKLMMLLTVGLIATLTANAQKEGDLVLSAGAAKKISLGEGMEVVLLNAKEINSNVTLTEKVMEKLDVSFSHGTMRIQKREAKATDTVYLVVEELQSVTLGENTRLTSQDVLPAGKLDLYVHDGAIAVLRTAGKVNAIGLGESSLQVKRTPVYANTASLTP